MNSNPSPAAYSTLGVCPEFSQWILCGMSIAFDYQNQKRPNFELDMKLMVFIIIYFVLLFKFSLKPTTDASKHAMCSVNVIVGWYFCSTCTYAVCTVCLQPVMLEHSDIGAVDMGYNYLVSLDVLLETQESASRIAYGV